eukprot:scaffold916_cov516-Prasinococcus_capsulatus_cf.AAC.28
MAWTAVRVPDSGTPLESDLPWPFWDALRLKAAALARAARGRAASSIRLRLDACCDATVVGRWVLQARVGGRARNRRCRREWRHSRRGPSLFHENLVQRLHSRLRERQPEQCEQFGPVIGVEGGGGGGDTLTYHEVLRARDWRWGCAGRHRPYCGDDRLKDDFGAHPKRIHVERLHRLANVMQEV